MIDDQDFSVVDPENDPAEDEQAAVAPTAAQGEAPGAPGGDDAAAKPLVIVEYRNRIVPTLLLLPPLFVLALGIVVVHFRAQVNDWIGLLNLRIVRHSGQARETPPGPLALAPAASGQPGGTASGPSETDAAAVTSARPDTAKGHADASEFPLPDLSPPAATEAMGPPAPEDPAVKAQVGEKSEPPALAATEPPAGVFPWANMAPGPKPRPGSPLTGVGFDPPGTARLAPADADPDEDDRPGAGADDDTSPEAVAERTRRINEDIQREARQRASDEKHRRQLEALKPLWREQALVDGQKRRKQEIEESLQAADEDRPRFRAALQEILARGRGVQATAASIRTLCHQHGLEVLPEIEEYTMHSFAMGPAARFRRADRVRHFRKCGFPEARILDALATTENSNRGAKNGPRNDDEGVIRAARQLLAVPLTPPSKPAQASAAAPAAGSSSGPAPAVAPASARSTPSGSGRTPAARPSVANRR